MVYTRKVTGPARKRLYRSAGEEKISGKLRDYLNLKNKNKNLPENPAIIFRLQRKSSNYFHKF